MLSNPLSTRKYARRGMGAEVFQKYVKLARQRVHSEISGTLKTRPMDKPVYDPYENGCKLAISPWR